jgi:3-phosphoshikimate 1-carboxyvinyltransferase
VAKQYWPERLELVDAMPRNPVGKIKKFVLRDWARAQTGQPRPDNPDRTTLTEE